MNKTKIDWCDSTWNPVTGCLHGCEYCYARGIAERFAGFEPEENGEWNMIQYEKGGERLGVANSAQYRIANGKKISAPYPFGFIPTLHRYRLNDYIGKQGRSIFVCSMADLFGDWVPDSWIKEVFAACEKAPQHNYLFLTKNPGRYIELENDRGLPWADNFWFGSSVTKTSDRYTWFTEKKFHWFLSIEPILEGLGSMDEDAPKPEWVIIGAETGRRKDKVVPERKWIEDIVNECQKENVPVFMKSSLADIWGEPLIQELPEGLAR